MEEKEVKRTYEELEALVTKYENDIKAYAGLNNQLYQQLMSANMTNVYKRLDYLFKVLECQNCFPGDFIISCTDEIQNIMTPPEEEKQEEKK